jgi:hypothetical protein
MKTTEVNQSIVGRKCVGMVFGELVEGTITAVEENESTKTVFFDHKPVNWGGYTFTNSSNWARKRDQFGSLCHMTLTD